MNNQIEVLLVEDNPDDILFMKRAWRKCNIPNPLRIVRNGEECLNLLNSAAEQTPGLILMDIDMPVMNGLDCLRQIRTNHVFEHLPVIMFSGQQISDAVDLSYRIGCNSFIEKPDTFDDLQHTVRLIHSYWQRNRLPLA